LKYSIVNYALATAKYPDTLYRFSQGLFDEPLKTAIRNYTTQGYVVLGYNTARDKMYETIDKYLTNDTLECIYSGRKIRAVNRTEAQNQNFSCEHTYPQSFFNSLDPMVSDIYHLYPVDNTANNYRSNYPFGYVVSNITWEQGGSKLGKDFENQTVFEVRDIQKGNTARSLFYFCVKYNNISPGGFMANKQENVLRQWSAFDTVDWRERARNDRISFWEHVRNPFIDHPELIERIASTFSVIPNTPKPKISASPFNILFDTIAVNDTSAYYLSLLNYGTGTLSITSVSSSISQFIVESFPASVPQGELRYAKIKFKPTAINQTYNGTLTIQNSDSTITISLKGFSNSTIGISNITSGVPEKYNLNQNYPNPFNPSTTIAYSLPKSGDVELKLFSLDGREQAILFKGHQSQGSYILSLNAEMLNLPSGVYVYRMISAGFTATRKLTFLK